MEKRFSFNSLPLLFKQGNSQIAQSNLFKFILLLFFISIQLTSNSTNYYISSTGNDQNQGTSESQPWQTLEKVNSFIPSPGDQILFKRGDEWTGTITVKASGTEGNPIVYGAYGSGDKPKIYGSEVITGWTKHSGNIYKATFNTPINQLFIDDSKMKVARYPNSGYLYINTVQSPTQFTCNSLDGSIDYTGAKWFGRTRDWTADLKDVTSSTSNSVKLDSQPVFDLGVGEGFFLMNKLEFLDLPGEWFFETSSNTVYLRTENDDSPENHIVRGSTHDKGVYIRRKEYVNVNNLDILQSSEKGIYIYVCNNIIIDNNDISYPDGYGICDISESKNLEITNNKVIGANHHGMNLRISYSYIHDNIISRISLFDEIGITGTGSASNGSGIYLAGAEGNNTLSNNQITEIAYHGICFSKPNNLIEKNFINNVCLWKADGGGIYGSWSNPTLPDTKGTIIRNNIILNVIGPKEGYTSNRAHGNGIYLDESCEDIIVDNNTIAHCSDAGVFLHNNAGSEVKNNTVLDARYGIQISREHGVNSVHHNIIYALDEDDYQPNQLLARILNATQTEFNYNTYVNHFNSAKIFYNLNEYNDFNNWKNKTGQDANSLFDFSLLREEEKEELFYNETNQTKTINLGNTIYRDLSGNNVVGSFQLQSFTSKILIKTTEIAVFNQRPIIHSQNINVSEIKLLNNIIGQVTASDPDTDNMLNFSILSGNNDDLFSINPLSGEIYSNTTIAFHEETTIQLVVEVTDNASIPLSSSAIISITFSLPDLSPKFSEYLFEEESGLVVFDSKGSNDGNIFNEELRVNGIINNGLNLIGSNYVNLGQCFGNIVQNKLTLSAWIKPELTSDGYQGIIMHGGPTDDTYALYINPNLKSISFKTSGTSSPWVSIDSTENLWDGNWHFLSATYDGNVKTIYLDGEAILNVDASGIIESGEGYNLLIGAGRDVASPTHLYKGLIDEVRIYNYALSNTEINELHNLVDTIAPTITSFIIPSSYKSLIIPVSTLNAIDNNSAIEYLLTENDNIPTLDDIGWSSSVPSIYTFNEEGTKTLYAWVKDAAGNISNPHSGLVTITLPDLSPTFSEYLFEEEASPVIIDTKGSNDGIIVNEEIRVNGIINNGLKLTGANHVNLGQCFGDNVQNEVTLSAWIKPDATLKGYQGIIMHGGPIDDTYALYINPNLKSISFKTSGTSSAWTSIDNVNKLWDGNWHFLTATYNGLEKIIYLDGEAIINIDATGTIESGDGYNLLIGAGRDNAFPTLLYEGLIDEVRIHNYALTYSDINELYHLTDILITEDIEICEGTSYQGWNSEGAYKRTLQSTLGTDSIVTTNLWLNPTYNIIEEISIPFEENYLGWTESGEYQRNLTSFSGCDSIITTYLAVITPINSYEDIFICEGSSYQGWASAGQYQRVLQSITGVDSIVTTNLWIYPDYNTIEDITIVEGEEYYGWTEPGQYDRILSSISGCDSIVTTNLNVINHFRTIWENENGQNHMNISISDAYIDGNKLQIDDEIAIYDGNLCVGTAKLTATIDPHDINSYVQIITSQNDGNINGFTSGNNISFKIWDASEKVEKDVSNINYKRDRSSWVTSGKFLAGGTSVVEIGVIKDQQIQTQSINLKKGWNIFSTYLVPTNVSMESVQEDLLSNGQLLKVQDEAGNTYEEWSTIHQWVNNIGDIQEPEGYKIKVNSSCALEITGQAIDLPLNIEIEKGWNIISFPYNGSVDAMQVIQSLINNGTLEKIQDEKGNSIENWGQLGWFNSIGNFNAGEGYKVKVNENSILPIDESYLKSSHNVIVEHETTYFKIDYDGNGIDHMNINIIRINETDFQIGDEIAAFDGNICVGAVKLNNTHFEKGIVSIKTSVSEENMENGFIEGNSIRLRSWHVNSNEEIYQHQIVLEGEMIYQRNASVFIQLINQKSTDVEDLNFNEIEIYPNPARDKITIRFNELPTKGAKIILTDMTGKKIFTREVQSIHEVIDIHSQPAGIYFVKTLIGDNIDVRKLIIK